MATQRAAAAEAAAEAESCNKYERSITVFKRRESKSLDLPQSDFGQDNLVQGGYLEGTGSISIRD